MMQISHFSNLAQELVEAVSSLVRMRTVNIMDMEGVIIASTEPERIGTLHTGAQEVARTGKELLITPEMLPRYPGAKTGYNMPLSCRGERIGVIGIYGTRSDVMDLAHLLRVYAEKYFDLESVMNRELADAEQKSRLFQLLGSEQPVSPETLQRLAEMLGIRFRPPLLCVRIRLSEEEAAAKPGAEVRSEVAAGPGMEDGSLRAGALLEKLIKMGVADRKTDLYGTEDGEVILIRSIGNGSCGDWKEELQHALAKISFPLQIFHAETAEGLGALQKAYRQTAWMSGRMQRSADLCQPKDLVRYITARTAEAEAGFLEPYVRILRTQFRKNELETYLRCMNCYFEEEGSVGRTAERLFIHKNTVQYRIRRLYEVLSLQDEGEFVRRYLMRLVIAYMELQKMF